MTQILLIRHARNDWVGERLPGLTPGIHLSAEGRREAEALSRRLADYPLSAVYASSLERAVETAEAVAAPHGLPVVQLHDLRDVDTGDWTGRAIKELRDEEEWRRVLLAPSIARLPGGEALWEMQSRAVAAVEGLRANHPDDAVAVVAHADVIKSLIAHYTGVPIDMFQRLEVSTASVSVLRIGAYGGRLLAFNVTEALPRPPRNDDAPEAEHDPPRAKDGDGRAAGTGRASAGSGRSSAGSTGA